MKRACGRWLSILFALTHGTAMAAGAPSASAKDDATVGMAVVPVVVRGDLDRERLEGLEIVTGAVLERVPVLRAILPSDVRAMLSLEAQKQLLGCEADAACLAEIGGALGAPYILTTQVWRLGSRIVTQATVLDAQSARRVSRASREALEADLLPDAFREAVMDAVYALPEVRAAGLRRPDTGLTRVRRQNRWLPWTGLGAGIAGALTGATLFGVYYPRYARHLATEGEPPGTPGRLSATEASKARTLTWVGVGAGALGVGLSAWSAVVLVRRARKAKETEAEIALVPLRDGAVLLWTGRL